MRKCLIISDNFLFFPLGLFDYTVLIFIADRLTFGTSCSTVLYPSVFGTPCGSLLMVGVVLTESCKEEKVSSDSC